MQAKKAREKFINFLLTFLKTKRLLFVSNLNTSGGGIVSLEDIELVLEAGANKISMNSAAVKNPDLVTQAAKTFDKERVVVAIDAKRNLEMPSGFELVVAGGTKPVGKDAVSCL
jgi:cyclase